MSEMFDYPKLIGLLPSNTIVFQIEICAAIILRTDVLERMSVYSTRVNMILLTNVPCGCWNNENTYFPAIIYKM